MALDKTDRSRRRRLLATRRVDPHTVALMAAQRAERIGRRMRERREELGLTQTGIADRIPGASVTKDYVSRWERGKTEPSEAYLDYIAEALETNVEDLMAGPLTGRAPKGPTPDLVSALGDDPVAALLREMNARLARIELAITEEAPPDLAAQDAEQQRLEAEDRAAGDRRDDEAQHG